MQMEKIIISKKYFVVSDYFCCRMTLEIPCEKNSINLLSSFINPEAKIMGEYLSRHFGKLADHFRIKHYDITGYYHFDELVIAVNDYIEDIILKLKIVKVNNLNQPFNEFEKIERIEI